MSFPIINIKATNLDLSDELSSLVEQKLQPLERFLPKGAGDEKCDVELEKMTGQQSGRIYRAEVTLFIDGQKFRAEALEDQIEKAVDGVRDEVKKEIRRTNSKKESLIKRGGRKIKNMMRFGS